MGPKVGAAQSLSSTVACTMAGFGVFQYSSLTQRDNAQAAVARVCGEWFRKAEILSGESCLMRRHCSISIGDRCLEVFPFAYVTTAVVKV